jgi:ParB-like chromosome segregation protein Spo0J
MIQEISLKKLKLLDRNPRTITKTQMQKCIESLEKSPEFLHQRPVLVNLKDGVYTVYAGNQRVRAAKKIGWKNIPCLVSENVSEEELKKFIILDNAHFGENDDDILANDYDINLLLECGYTEKDLQLDVTPEYIEDEKEEESDEVNKYCPHCNGVL